MKNDKDSHENKQGLPWFFINGTVFPKPQRIDSFSLRRRPRLLPLLPDKYEDNDRIVDQLMFVPNDYLEILTSGKLKKIHLVDGVGAWNIEEGRSAFINSNCPVSTCTIENDLNSAHLVIFKNMFQPLKSAKPPNQLYMLYYLESPMHTSNDMNLTGLINWMSTYR